MADNQNSITRAADILVVDDTIASLKLVTDILSAEGYQVRPADGPHLALQSALAHPPSLILLDVRMPGMDGFEVCRRLKQDERTRDVPVIFVSALHDVDDRVRGFEVGGVDFVSKPIEEAEVLARVKTHLQLRTMQLHLEELVVERTAELVQVNEALRESEERYRSVVQDTPVMLCSFTQNEKILFANQAYCDYFDKKIEELVGSSFLQMIPEGDRDRVLADIAVLTPEAPVRSHEHRVLAPDGQIHWQRWTNRAFFDEKGRVLVYQAFGEDITERMRAEESLRQRDAILSAVSFAAQRFLSALDWEAEMDAILAHLGQATNTSRVYVFQNHAESQGKILTSQRFEWCAPGTLPQIDNPDLQSLPLRASGFGRWEEVLGRGNTIHGHARAFPESERKVLAVQDIQSLVIVPVFIRGLWWGFVGFDECQREREWSRPEQDALRVAANTLGAAMERQEANTQREAARKALRESEENYRTLVEQAQDGVAVVQEDRIRFANSYVASLSGRTVQELLDTPFEAYLVADQIPQARDFYRRRLNGEDVPTIYESAIRHKDGSRVEVEFNVGPTTYDGRPAALVFVRDIRERLKARRELEASQRLLSLVIDNVPAQISYVDKKQRYRFVNERYEQAYGIPPSAFVGKPVSEILGPEGYAAAEPQIAAALAGQRISYEHVFHYPDRVQRWMSIDYVPDRHPAGDVQGFVGLVRDITESKQAEAALRESEEKLRAIYEAIPVAAYTWQREGNDFVLVDYNEMAAKITEGRIVDLVGKRASEMYRDLPEIPEAMARCSSERLTIEEEMDYQLLTTGRRRYLNVKYAFAPPDLVVVHTEDITARKRAEEELRKSNERLEEAQRTAQIGDWEYDILAGKVTWSDEMFRIRGVDPEQYVPTAKSDEEFCHPDDVPALFEAYERFFATGKEIDIDYRIVTPQGTVRACRRRGRLIVNAEGVPSLAIGTTEDITERWLVEQQITEYQQRLQALASQLTLTEERERRRIARELHDEVGQTLAFARTGLASARKAASEAQREAILDDVSQALRQAIRDTRDLVFDLSSPLMNELGLGAALGEWLDDQVSKKHGLRTEFIYDGKRFPLDDDMRAILFRCTRELLTNVVKHARARRVAVRLEDDGPLVRIAVEDDGIGYDLAATPDTLEREAGFGLFSIQERMADLGGSLEIRSEPGQGCTAILTAPATVQV